VPAQRPPEIWFEVSDTGIGIAPTSCRACLSPLVRPTNPLAAGWRDWAGLGDQPQACGLMGGKLSLDSTVHKGTCTRFTIPYTACPNIGDEPWKGRFTGRRILAKAVPAPTAGCFSSS